VWGGVVGGGGGGGGEGVPYDIAFHFVQRPGGFH